MFEGEFPEQVAEPSPEQPENKKERGKNTEVLFTFIRHGQKNKDGFISPDGRSRAEDVGARQLKDRKINMAYWTNMPRTLETLLSAFTAAGVYENIQKKLIKAPAFFSLPGFVLKGEYQKTFYEKLNAAKEEYIKDHFQGRKFGELNFDEQEEVEEVSGEDALQSYLDYDAKRPDEETLSPREMAATVAYKINRLYNLTDYMPNERKVDLVSAGHKTSTEAFLKYVLEREVDGKKVVGFDKLEEIGGSLRPVDGWDLKVANDAEGNKEATITLWRENGEKQEYKLNKEELKKLAGEHIESNQLYQKEKNGEIIYIKNKTGQSVPRLNKIDSLELESE